ncbi:DUF386 domain-containing protein [Romboutsia ilealis]|uniref:YhcH/YjgK/YiaL family protein n=1 Tax=Romboutsia faecis TaxID=2764597 RepID=A0ABR7JNN8_9FIRM|nr:YhcH/YjgK/YiaL family protein [Romboutsia faecis]MBC5996535.1 YhcH/YjgK/YiaL family protein [Romboutsia faecis]MRN24061.1 DUF386 domain-containing protein [Romboutsia ilealis]
MIVDKIDNILFYKPMVNNLEAGIKAIKEIKILEEGKYTFEGGYFMIQKGDTKPMDEGTFEAHRKYVDIQIVVEGSEEIAWADISELKTVNIYDSVKDVERLDGDKSHNILISKGMFYIAFPHDGHKPVSHIKQRLNYTKIVMKLLV